MRACMSESSASKPPPASTPIRRTRSPCCANASSGHAAAEPAITLINSRRLTLEPYHTAGAVVHHSKFRWLMSALGQKRTSEYVWAMSALPPKADIGTGPRSTQQLRQLSDIRRDPPRLVLREQFG